MCVIMLVSVSENDQMQEASLLDIHCIVKCTVECSQSLSL